MKLKRKLLAAGLALGATALTLTTSTYAWYTANTEVSMSGVTGGTASSGSETLLISATGEAGTFSGKATYGLTTGTLKPVEYTAGTASAPTFKHLNNGTLESASAGDVLTFTTYFKSNEASEVNIKSIKIKNSNKDSLPTADVYTTTGLGGWTVAEDGKTYTINVLRTLKMAYYTETFTEAGGSTATATSDSSAYDLTNVVQSCDGDDYKSGMNALTYYNAVSSTQLVAANAKPVSTALSTGTKYNIGTTPAGTEDGTHLKVTFFFFVDGWDDECFDAVKGQTFTVEMEFTSQKSGDASKLTAADYTK